MSQCIVISASNRSLRESRHKRRPVSICAAPTSRLSVPVGGAAFPSGLFSFCRKDSRALCPCGSASAEHFSVRTRPPSASVSACGRQWTACELPALRRVQPHSGRRGRSRCARRPGRTRLWAGAVLIEGEYTERTTATGLRQVSQEAGRGTPLKCRRQPFLWK